MKSKLLSLTAALLSVIVIVPLILTGCEKEESYPENDVAMWEVTSKDTNAKIYLLGSIHAAKEDTFPLRDTIMDAFEKSDYLAVEFNTTAAMQDTAQLIKCSKLLYYNDGTTIKDHLTEENYTKSKAILEENNMYSPLYDLMNCGFWESLLLEAIMQESNIDYDAGIDSTFIDMATEKGKTILDIESMEFQFGLLSSFSDTYYNMDFKNMLDNIDGNAEQLNQLYDAWKTGDIAEFLEEDSEDLNSLTDEEKQAYDDYEKAMLTDRNIGMADKAEEYLKEDKNVFYVVGFAHMIGDNGIVQLLKDRGYTVKRV